MCFPKKKKRSILLFTWRCWENINSSSLFLSTTQQSSNIPIDWRGFEKTLEKKEAILCKSGPKFWINPPIDLRVRDIWFSSGEFPCFCYFLKSGFPDISVCFCLFRNKKWRIWTQPSSSIRPSFPLWSILIVFYCACDRCVFYAHELKINSCYRPNSCWWIAQQWQVLEELLQEW